MKAHIAVSRSVLALALALAVGGCGLLPESPTSEADRLTRELSEAEQRWAALGASSYRFTVAYHCLRRFRDPVDVVVDDDAIVSITTADGAPAPMDEVSWWPTTIPAAFGQVRDNLEADEITAIFDRVTGIPTNVQVDTDTDTFDDEFSFEVSSFSATD